MHPFLLRIPLPLGGAFRLPSYGFMIMCGFLASLFIMQRRARRAGIDPNAVFDVAIAVLLGGIVGARIMYVARNWPLFRSDLFEIIRIDKGGLVFYGGLVGGVLLFLIVVLKRKLPTLKIVDVLASVMPLGHAFGRVGCFLNGCCFGRVTDSWVGVRFPRILEPGTTGSALYHVAGEHIVGSPAFVYHLQGMPAEVAASMRWSLPVHPTQLYAVGYNLLIFVVLSYLFWRRWRDGEIAWLYLVFYGSARFANEIFRVEPQVLWGLTAAQLMCVLFVLLGFVMFLRGRLRSYQPFPEPWQPPVQ